MKWLLLVDKEAKSIFILFIVMTSRMYVDDAFSFSFSFDQFSKTNSFLKLNRLPPFHKHDD
jgi:hypothetical protein